MTDNTHTEKRRMFLVQGDERDDLVEELLLGNPSAIVISSDLFDGIKIGETRLTEDEALFKKKEQMRVVLYTALSKDTGTIIINVSAVKPLILGKKITNIEHFEVLGKTAYYKVIHTQGSLKPQLAAQGDGWFKKIIKKLPKRN